MIMNIKKITFEENTRCQINHDNRTGEIDFVLFFYLLTFNLSYDLSMVLAMCKCHLSRQKEAKECTN